MKVKNLKIDDDYTTMIVIDIADGKYQTSILISRDKRKPNRTNIFFIEHRSYDES